VVYIKLAMSYLQNNSECFTKERSAEAPKWETAWHSYNPTLSSAQLHFFPCSLQQQWTEVPLSQFLLSMNTFQHLHFLWLVILINQAMVFLTIPWLTNKLGVYMRLEPFRLHYQDVQQRHKSFFIDNTNKCTSIETYTFTYNAVRLLYVSIFFWSFSEILHQSYMKTQMNYQTH
jgi:hypothetical protein